MKVMALIPAYNEQPNIRSVIKDIQYYQPKLDVVVINDGSTDATSLEAREAGALVINLPQNLGIGGAVQTGYIYAQRQNYDFVIQIDADGQHDPKDISKLLEIVTSGNADMVIGSRFVTKTDYKSSLMRRVGIAFFTKLVSFLCRKNFYDTTSGFRAMNKKAVGLFSRYYPQDYPEVEAIVYASKRGIKIKEISVNMRNRQGGRSSITPLRSIYYMLKVTCVLLLQPSSKEEGMIV